MENMLFIRIIVRLFDLLDMAKSDDSNLRFFRYGFSIYANDQIEV